ncbi:hypothetical protein SAMN05421813_105147 [Daejeonella rubra]|uniref:Metal binding domain of Ada n=1 Tax=Daejeonella rubra TaxID=990371 RepID=A0A1G9Q8I7_9SPHI|nr:hypothetical protein [Daejeonella rubra]SDM06777.1 hypothetical protein SAMN05421813_105147 [Daejeonella rubra]
MLRYIGGLVLFAVFILSVNSLIADPASGYKVFPNDLYKVQETVVYVTNTGTKYHKSSCRYLNQSKIKTTLKKAMAAGNGACKVCKP